MGQMCSEGKLLCLVDVTRTLVGWLSFLVCPRFCWSLFHWFGDGGSTWRRLIVACSWRSAYNKVA